MSQWNVSAGKKKGGPYDEKTIKTRLNSRQLTTDVFVQRAIPHADWQHAATIEWLSDSPDPGVPRYCLECDCRAIVPVDRCKESFRCPECSTLGPFVDFLDDTVFDLLDVRPSPWGAYDSIAVAFACLAFGIGLIGTCAFLFNPSLLLLIGFILFACGAGLFSLTFQYRSESSKYRSHLEQLESMLTERTTVLVSTSRELQSLKRNLQKVRSDIEEFSKEEFRVARKRLSDELAIARDSQNAIHRMAERFLTETRKWWTSKLNGQNYSLTKERILKAIEFCKKQGYPVTKAQEKEVFRALALDFDVVLRLEHQKAEQSRIREQMREEARVQREVRRKLEVTNREAMNLQREKMIIEQALDAAKRTMGAQYSADVQRLEASLLEAEARLLEAQEASRRTQALAESTKVGNVYVISNIGSFGENGYKVGLTRRADPMERVNELGDASVPFPFDVHMMIRSDDAPALERKLHLALHRYRVNRVNFRKEFFRVDLSTIRKIVKVHCGEVEYEYPGRGEESEYELSRKVSDQELMSRIGDAAILENEDDDLDGLDQLGQEI